MDTAGNVAKLIDEGYSTSREVMRGVLKQLRGEAAKCDAPIIFWITCVTALAKEIEKDLGNEDTRMILKSVAKSAKP